MKKILMVVIINISLFGIALFVGNYFFEKYKVQQLFADIRNNNFQLYDLCVIPPGGFPITEGYSAFKGKRTHLPYSDSLINTNVSYVVFTKSDSKYFFIFRIDGKKSIDSLVDVVCDRQKAVSLLSEL
jgi:hypothetical protein